MKPLQADSCVFQYCMTLLQAGNLLKQFCMTLVQADSSIFHYCMTLLQPDNSISPEIFSQFFLFTTIFQFCIILKAAVARYLFFCFMEK